MHDTLKIVFSKNTQSIEGNNTQLFTGDMVAEINALKASPGKDIIAYGGANFVSNLIQAGLIDEYHLFVNPAALGNGLPIFKNMNGYTKLTLVNTTKGTCGIIILHYEPLKS